MPDPFLYHALGVESPATGALAVTPSDSTDLPTTIRSLTIGTAGGTVAFIGSRDGQTYSTGPLPVGSYPLLARRILATGTTATGLTGWY